MLPLIVLIAISSHANALYDYSHLLAVGTMYWMDYVSFVCPLFSIPYGNC